MKGLRVAVSFIVTSCIMGFCLGFLSAYLESRGERPIAPANRMVMILGMSGVVASIVSTRAANRNVSRAAAADEKEAKRFAPVADRATVYVFRDARLAKVAGLDVLLDGAPVGQTRGKTFYRLQITPGEHVLTSRNPHDGSQHEHRMSGDAGSVSFFEQRVGFGMTSLKHQMVPADAEKAATRIQRCRLLDRQLPTNPRPA